MKVTATPSALDLIEDIAEINDSLNTIIQN